MSTAVERLREISKEVMLRHDWLFWSFIAINVVGLVWGTVGWYGQQLPATPLIWWLFVPDCPLVAGQFALALWGIRNGRQWTIFNLWTAMGLIKYGVWTCLVWIAYWMATGNFIFISIAMFITHVGLIAQGIVLLLLTERWTVREVVPALAYYVLADTVDYRLGHHPTYPWEVNPSFVQWHTVLMTWLLGFSFMGMAKFARKEEKRAAVPVNV